MSSKIMFRACSNCGKPTGHICDPCPHCGYKPKLTKAGEEYCKRREKENKNEK